MFLYFGAPKRQNVFAFSRKTVDQIATYFADNALGEESRNVLNFRGLPFLQPDQLPHGGNDHLQCGITVNKIN